MKKLSDIFRTVLFLGVILFGVIYFQSRNLQSSTGAATVIDGDSLRINGQEIRLFGIDAPEFKQVCNDSNDRIIQCGRIARQHLKEMITNESVDCKGSEYDKFERLLATCSIKSVELNSQMVLDGWAVAFGAYFSEENLAKQHRKGIWAGTFQTPADWREDDRQAHEAGWMTQMFNWFGGEGE